MKSIKDWQTEVHNLAKEKGWWEAPKSDLEVLALVHSEISEAVEELRENNPPMYRTPKIVDMKIEITKNNNLDKTDKPEGAAIELADAVLRILDYFEYKGWDLEFALQLKHEFNKDREYRHGNKLY